MNFKENPVIWLYLNKKIAYPSEYFNSLQYYQKPVDDIKKKDFLSNLINKYPDDEQIERTKEFIKWYKYEIGEELSQLYLKSDIILLTDVFESFIKISIKKFTTFALYCVSLPSYTWQCWMRYTKINLQTLQDKDLILTLQNNIGRRLSSVKGDRYVVPDENKKILYIDANNSYGWAMSQMLPYDEIEIWVGHPELYMDKLEDILNTEDDSDVGEFVEVDINYPDNMKQKTKVFPIAPEKKISAQD